MTVLFDLDAYLDRIGYEGPMEPSFETLAQLQLCHVQSIPFENLDIHLGRGVRTDLESVQRKLVDDRRGGYCFEQNTLFAAALTALGFEVKPLAARVTWQLPPDREAPVTHMLLLVTIDGRRWVADVGFGSGPVTPLVLDTEEGQTSSHDTRRFVRRAAGPGELLDTYIHQMIDYEGEWMDLYEFTVQPRTPIDYEVANWWTSTHPRSQFTQRLVLALATPTGRVAINDRTFTARSTTGEVSTRELDDEELLAVLSSEFLLDFPPGTRFTKPSS